MKKAMGAILLALAAAQIAVPLSMIRTKERILREGELFRFKTRPIDPADPFRGRYVLLGIEEDHVLCPEVRAKELAYRQPCHVAVENDSDGFARLSEWSLERPASGNYLSVRSEGPYTEWNQKKKKWVPLGARFDLPFDRYYMDETKAPLAEKAVREATRSTNCWVEVRILGGKAAIEDVYVAGVPLRKSATAPQKGKQAVRR